MAYKNLIQLGHPLVKTYITKIRDKGTSYFEFREYVDKLSMLLAYETAKMLELRRKKVITPLAVTGGFEIKNEVVLMPILRAGLGMVFGFNQLFPEARISHLGVYRNETTLQPVRYYFKFPKLKNKKDAIVYILDPMLATGGSMCSAIEEVKKTGIKKIVAASIVSAPEGVKEVFKYHKDVKIFTCALDQKLNDIGYIVPGLGDAGDRLFGTL
ncbi:MAG: uracil phosphoribosyltransferase [Ignavibacteria bacterium]